jgi:hypothetical protein
VKKIMAADYEENRKIPLDKIIFVIACVYLGGVVAWLISQKNAPVAENATISSENQQFIAYLQSSLQIIDQQKKNPPSNPNPSPQNNPSPVATIPPPPTANLPANSPRVIERIYVPVYPQTPQPTAKIVPIAPTDANISPPPVPQVNTPPVATVIPTNNQIKNTLVGVMDLGDRSSALFDNKGITARISPGEFINGWTLIEVRNQQVILSRNGKTKVVEVGQSF